MKKPDKALKLMQHALHISAAETVSLRCRPTLPVAWFNMFNDVNVRQFKAGRIERLVIATDFSAVHPAVFEVSEKGAALQVLCKPLGKDELPKVQL